MKRIKIFYEDLYLLDYINWWTLKLAWFLPMRWAYLCMVVMLDMVIRRKFNLQLSMTGNRYNKLLLF